MVSLPPVELSGAQVPNGNGLDVRTQCTTPGGKLTIHGLAIHSFPEDGIHIAPAGEVYTVAIDETLIGTDAQGEAARPNGSRGIFVHSPVADVEIERSVIAGNNRSGIYIANARNVFISQSEIGLHRNIALGNGASGVFVHRGNVEIGGTWIANNRVFGVAVMPGAKVAAHRSAGIYANGVNGIDWGLNGPTRRTEAYGAPNAPIITTATYDPSTGQTLIRGTLTIGRILGERYDIEVFSSRPGSRAPQGEERHYSFTTVPFHGAPGTYEWETVVYQDLRGKVVTAVSAVAEDEDWRATVSSEFGGGRVVE
jgi:hypothetical protein